ncbi:MAG: sensor histidine kinase [Taibaiella sp.]|jgi:sensor histidine kinase YesM
MKKNTKWHIIFWTCYFFYAYAADLVFDSEYTTFKKEIVFFLTANIYLFYTLFYCINKFSAKTTFEIIKSLSRFAVVLSVFLGIRHLIRLLIISGYFGDRNVSLPIDQWFVSSILWIGNYILFASGYFYFQSSIQKQKDLLKATEEKAIKEKEAAELENKALRAQINPHFLFNTLGYFYNEVSDLHPRVGDGIAALSDIMRSAIRKPDKDGLIPLDEEINNIEQLISIYELRYNSSVYISFMQEGNSYGVRILPHILNTLVENGFKHGELHNAERPLTITLNISEGNIFFRINNKKRTGPKELSHGIGMTYIRTHLDSVYEGRYTLTIDDAESFYTASLNIMASALVAA